MDAPTPVSRPDVIEAPERVFLDVLIVDDERLSRDRLRILLEGESDVRIVGECENGLQALAAITSLGPDLVFLDVQMPDLDGIGVIEALGDDETPEIVFVTAYSVYMERAFELHAVDFLRKPYTNARFLSALAHARKRVHARRAEQRDKASRLEDATPASRYSPILATLQGVHADPRLALQDTRTGSWHIVSRLEVDWIEADGNARVLVHLGKEAWGWNKTLAELERTLDPKMFIRIHRSYIVNATHIRHVKPLQRGEYAITLTDGTVLDSGRSHRPAVERFLADVARGG